MDNKNNGGPAFPFEHTAQPGMTLRDYFAAQSIAAAVTKETYSIDWHHIAESAYDAADAMLEARKA